MVASVRFAFDLNAFLHLAMDVTPACEHCRTSISNVLWRNPISGFNGSSQATHPGSHEIYARVKLVYSISFPIFNYCHYCSACYWFPSQNGINKLWVDQKWGQLRWPHIRRWGLQWSTMALRFKTKVLALQEGRWYIISFCLLFFWWGGYFVISCFYRNTIFFKKMLGIYRQPKHYHCWTLQRKPYCLLYNKALWQARWTRHNTGGQNSA